MLTVNKAKVFINKHDHPEIRLYCEQWVVVAKN